MFTGIVERMGTLRTLETRGGHTELCVEVDELAAEVKVGDSVALNGCCLTVTRVEEGALWFQAIPETLARTSLGDRVAGERINLERALSVQGRLDGHIVQGHVDGTGEVRGIDRDGDDVRMTVSCGTEIAELLVQKGSIAVDGVALTVVDPDAGGFSVALIPHTLAITTLGERVPGDRVNLEADVLGKYVRQFLERRGRSAPS